jgi:hypothetical protein
MKGEPCHGGKNTKKVFTYCLLQFDGIGKLSHWSQENMEK